MPKKPETVKEEGLTIRKNGLYYKKYARKPFTGTSLSYPHDPGRDAYNLSKREHYIDGFFTGISAIHHERGLFNEIHMVEHSDLKWDEGKFFKKRIILGDPEMVADNNSDFGPGCEEDYFIDAEIPYFPDKVTAGWLEPAKDYLERGLIKNLKKSVLNKKNMAPFTGLLWFHYKDDGSHMEFLDSYISRQINNKKKNLGKYYEFILENGNNTIFWEIKKGDVIRFIRLDETLEGGLIEYFDEEGNLIETREWKDGKMIHRWKLNR